MRQQIYQMIKKAEPGDHISRIYDIFIVVVAFVSMVPLMFKDSNPALDMLDIVTVYILFVDYILRWITYDYAGKTKGVKAFIKYPFTPFAILNFVSLLPSMGLLGPGFRVLRLLRIFTVFHYSKHLQYIGRVFKKEAKTLLVVLAIALLYIFISALAIFTYEPETFGSFFEALYWATTALTTVGYGDFSPVTDLGRLISMVSSLFGIAVIAMPAGIVTAGFVEEMNKSKAQKENAIKEPAPAPMQIQHRPVLSRRFIQYSVIIIISVLLNEFLNMLATTFNWPVWLDLTGTAYAALVLEPAAGLIVGLADNMILAITAHGAHSLIFFSISAFVALMVGVFLKNHGRFTLKRILVTIILVIIVSAALSAAIDLWITNGGAPDSYWENLFYTQAINGGWPHIAACFWGAFVVKAFDTIATAAIVAILYFVTPKKVRQIAS